MHEPELDIADAQREVMARIDPLPAVTLPPVTSNAARARPSNQSVTRTPS